MCGNFILKNWNRNKIRKEKNNNKMNDDSQAFEGVA